MWWVLDDKHMPAYAEGLSCAPMNADAWWFPTKGFSVDVTQCFFTEEAARAEALRRLAKDAAAIEALMARLRTDA